MRKLPKYNEVIKLDKKIEQYREAAFSLNDQLTIDRIKIAIARLEARREVLHREQE